ncbi:MAG: tyrosine-type recombinase/integrase [Eubacterium sp.]|nr:tyrosine-type recombinase/integrase [Eubacterium sp.]
MGRDSQYNREKQRKYREKLKELKTFLPRYTYDFLDEKAQRNPNTAVSYAYDLLTFFEYLKEFSPGVKNIEIKDIPLEHLEKLTFQDINEYQKWLDADNVDFIGEQVRQNGSRGIARRMSALRGFFKFECLHGEMDRDPSAGAMKQAFREGDHAIIRMTASEVKTFLDAVENSAASSERQAKLLQKTKFRDVAIITLLLNTGIRVSECVSLDIDDINFNENSLLVVRKGGKEHYLYFNDDVAEALNDYIELERPLYIEDEDEKALFLSNRKKRIAVRSVQVMVKKFSKIAVPNKKISPHKLRSTYGTALYNQTGDIRLVADVLGHSDINTTAKHYAAMEDARRRKAATIDPYKEE